MDQQFEYRKAGSPQRRQCTELNAGRINNAGHSLMS